MLGDQAVTSQSTSAGVKAPQQAKPAQKKSKRPNLMLQLTDEEDRGKPSAAQEPMGDNEFAGAGGDRISGLAPLGNSNFDEQQPVFEESKTMHAR